MATVKEYLFRIVQHLFSLFIFDTPFLNEIKRNMLRLFISIGPHSYIAYGSFLVAPHSNKKAFLKIGRNVAIEHRCDIDYSGGITIKDNVWISERTIIATHTHIITYKSLKKNQPINFSSLIVYEDAWLGAGSIILPNVRSIGKGAIVGAGSVVTKSVPDYSIVVGNPAEIIRVRE